MIEDTCKIIGAFSDLQKVHVFLAILGGEEPYDALGNEISKATIYRIIQEFINLDLLERREKGIRGKTRPKYAVTEKGRKIFEKIQELDSLVQTFRKKEAEEMLFHEFSRLSAFLDEDTIDKVIRKLKDISRSKKNERAPRNL